MNVPTIDINLYGPEIAADPWPLVRQIREMGPVVYNKRGQYVTAQDRVCREIMTHPEKAGMKGVMSSIFGEEAFISIDEPTMHNALRNAWVSAFGKNGVEKLVPHTRKIASGLLDDALEKLETEGQVDMQPVFCRPIPAYVIAHMMGVEREFIPTIIRWADDMARATANGHPIDYDNDPCWLKSEQAKADLGDFLIEQIGYRSTNPGNDLVSAIVHSDIGQQVSTHQMMVNLRQLLFAGNETTSNWLGHIVTILGERPDIREELRRDRTLVPAALEEVLRWLGVSQVLPRTVCDEGAVIGGVDLPAGAHVMAMVGAAGRDPARYANPEEFDIHRPQKPHLAFGFGMHSCLGATLARMEALQVTNLLLDRLPDYHFAAPITYDNFILRGPSRLLIEISAA